MLAKAECQLIDFYLIHRIREHARSHIWNVVTLSI